MVTALNWEINSQRDNPNIGFAPPPYNVMGKQSPTDTQTSFTVKSIKSAAFSSTLPSVGVTSSVPDLRSGDEQEGHSTGSTHADWLFCLAVRQAPDVGGLLRFHGCVCGSPGLPVLRHGH